MQPHLLAASDWGLAVAIAVLFVLFLIVGWVIVQGTRTQLYWRRRADEGDVEAIQMLVGDEVTRWKTAKTPNGVAPSVWHGVQSAELVEVQPDRVRLTAAAEGQYALVDGQRREVTDPLKEGMRVTAQLADMALYDIPNVRLPFVQVDVYSTYRDDAGATQRCILSTLAARSVGDQLDWEGLDAEEIVRAFGGRYALDDRGHPLPIDPVPPPANGVPAVYYED